MRVLALVVASVLLVGTPASRAATAEPVGVWPLQPAPEVVADFDLPDEMWGAGHRGVDLLGSPGQAVHTALPGQVTYAGLLAGRGVVVVDHGETRTTYEPVTAAVGVGDVLSGGDVIGRLDAAGSHCPPRTCLHWGWLRGDVYLDPLGLVGVGAVRLLPLWREHPVPSLVAGGRRSIPAFEKPTLPYAALLFRLTLLTETAPAGWPLGSPDRAPPPYARGCACW